MLFDNNGMPVDVHTFARKGGFCSWDAAVDYAVEALGFVWVELTDRGCQVRLNAKKTDRRAEAALFFWLNEAAPNRVVVYFVHARSIPQIYPGVPECIAATSKILEAGRREDRWIATRPFDPLCPSTALSKLASTYRAGRNLREFATRGLVEEATGGRFLIVERVMKSKKLMLRAMGRDSYYRSWAADPASRSIDDQPDLQYGTWLADCYHTSLDDMSPQAEEVDALVFRPREGKRRLRYRRLILPFRVQGREFLLSTSLKDTAIDLGIQ